MLRTIRDGLRGEVMNRVRQRLANADPEVLREWIAPLIKSRTSTLSPRESLRFLLELETLLRRAMDEEAIRLDGGVHAKHRLTQYCVFFVERIKPSDTVLDVGCGPGVVAHEVSVATGATVVAVDLLERNIEEARRRFAHPRIRYVHGDVTRGVPQGRFDVTILSNVLEHIADRPGLLAAIHRDTGCRRFLIRVPVSERDWHVALRRELGLDERLDETHETEYTQESFARETAAAGLTVVDQKFRWGEIWAECVRR